MLDTWRIKQVLLDVLSAVKSQMMPFICLGYTGFRCQTNINECAADAGLCLNGATCIDTPGSFKCDCSLGFSGIQCQNVCGNIHFSFFFST